MAEEREEIEEKFPHGDTTPNTGTDGEPPPTWDPGKVTQPPAKETEDEEGQSPE